MTIRIPPTPIMRCECVSLLACGPAITAQTQTPATAATIIRARITRNGKLTEGGSERQPYIARPLRVQVRKDWTVATLLRASPSWQARPVAYLMRGRPAPRAVYTGEPRDGRPRLFARVTARPLRSPPAAETRWPAATL